MKTPFPVLVLIAGAFAVLNPSPAQDAAAPPAAESTDSAGKALRYYEALVKRPSGGYLFDRFYNAWLDSQTIDELEKFLTSRAAAPDAGTAQRLILAFFYAKQNESAKALTQFQQALEKDPGNAEAWLQKAQAESRAANIDTALKDLEKSLTGKPNKETARAARELQGRLLVRGGRQAEAVKVWQALLAAEPQDEELHEDLVEVQLAEGLTDEALKTAEALLAKTKDAYQRVQRRLRTGDIKARMGDRDGALAAYAECLGEVGGDSWLEKEILAQIDQVYRRDDAVTGLRDQYAELIAKHPQRVALRRAFAGVQAELGETEAALKSWQELLALAPGDRTLRESYVQMLADNKKLPEAVTQMQALITQQPDDPELLIQLAALHWRAAQNDECRRALEAFLAKADASTETAALRVAGLMERYNLVEAAHALYAQTAQKFPDSESVLLAQASALHRAEKKTEAIAVWRKLAEGADGARLSAIARGVAAREEHALAEELLAARLKDFAADTAFLQFYCDCALRADKPAAAVAPARSLLNLAKDPIAMDAALATNVRVLDRAKTTATTLKELQGAELTPQEKCLLAELLEKSGRTNDAEAVLREVAAVDASLGHAALVRVQSARYDFKAAATSQLALVNSPGGRRTANVQRLIELYERAGLNDKALEWIPEWKKLSPGSVQVWIRESDLLAISGKPAEALRVMRQAAQQFPGDQDIRLRLGEAFRTEGKFADAARLYTMLFEEAKETADKVRFAGELARTADMSGSMSALLEQFEERRQGNRGSILPLLALAEIHRASGNYEGRRKALMEANRVKQGDFDLLMEIARMEEAEGDLERALETLNEARKLDKSGAAADRTVKVLFASGRDHEAMELFYQQSGGDRMNPRMAEEMIVELISMSLWEEAETLLQKLTTLHPGDYRLGYLRAIALEEMEKHDAAAAEYLRLLTLRDELVLPKKKPAAGDEDQQGPTNVFNDDGYYYGGMRTVAPSADRLLPAALPEIERFFRDWYAAYGYQRQRGYSMSLRNSAGWLPVTLKDLRIAVLAHCRTMSTAMAAEKRAPFWKEVRDRTPLPPEIFDASGVALENLDPAAISKRLLEGEKNDLLLAVVCRQGDVKKLPLAVVARAWDTFKDQWPTLAWPVLWAFIKETSEDSTRPLREAADRAKAMTGLPPVELLPAYTNFALGTIDKDVNEAAGALREILFERARDWYRQLLAGGLETDAAKSAANQLRYIVAGQLLESDAKAWVAFVEEELVRMAKEPEPPILANRGRNTLIAPLTWPCVNISFRQDRVLSGFVSISHLASSERLSIRTGPNSTSGYGGYGGRPSARQNELTARYKEALPFAKDASLRFRLRLLTDPDPAPLIGELESFASPAFHELVLAASWHRREDQPDKALALLQRAAAMDLDNEDRRLLDQIILTFSLEATDNRSGLRYADNEAMMKAGREAAARLGKESLRREETRLLSGMMQALGMEAEAKLVLARVQGPQSQQQQSRSRFGGYFGTGANVLSRAQQLLEKGRRDLAVRLMARELKRMAKERQDRDDDDYEMRQWTQLINRFALKPELMKSFAVADSESDSGRLGRSAYVFTVLGAAQEARALLEKADALKPHDPNTLQSLIRVYFKEAPAKAAALADTLPPESYGPVGTAMGNNIGRVKTHAEQIARMDLATKMLERLKPEDFGKANVAWFTWMLNNFARTGKGPRGDSLPSLYNVPRPPKWSDIADAAYRKTMDERRAALDRFCHAALKIPGCARRAASVLAALQTAEGKPVAELLPMLREAVLLTARGPVAPGGAGGTTWSDNDREIEIPPAEAFFARHAFDTNNPKLLEEMEAEVKKATPPETTGPVTGGLPGMAGVSGFAANRTFYFGTGAEIIKSLSDAGWPSTAYSIEDPNAEVFHAMMRRKMEPGLEPLVENFIRSNSWGASNPGMRMAELLLKVKSPVEASAWMDKVAEVYLGPLKTRRATLTSSGNLHSFLRMFSGTTGDAALTFFMADQYWKQLARFWPKPRNSYYGGEWNCRAANIFVKPNAAEALAILRASPFLGDVATFNPLPRDLTHYNADEKEATIFESSMILLSKYPAGVKAEIIKGLEPEAKQAGTAMVRAWLSAGKPAESLLAALVPHFEAMKSLPADKSGEWAWLSARLRAELTADAALPPEQKALRDWLDEFTKVKEAESDTNSADKFLKAKSLQDAGMQYHELPNFVQAVLPDLLRTDPAKGGALLKQLRKLAAVQAKSAQSSSLDYYVTTGVTGALTTRAQALTKSSDAAAALKEAQALLDAVTSPEGYALNYDNVATHCLACLRAAAREPVKDGKKESLSIPRLLTAMQEHLDPKAGALLVSELQDLLLELKVQLNASLRADLEKLVAAKADAWSHQLLSNALEMRMRPHGPWEKREKEKKAAADARSAAKSAGQSDAAIEALPDPDLIGVRALHQGITERDKLPASQKALLTLAEDVSLPVSLRAGILYRGMLKDNSTEPVLLLAAARLMAESWRGGQPLDEGKLRDIGSRLAMWLSQPGVTAPAEMKPAMSQIIGSWRTALRNPNARAYRSGGPAGFALLEIAILMDDDEAIAGVISGGVEQATAQWIARLVNAGKFEPAARLVLNGKDSLLDGVVWHYKGSVADLFAWHYSRALHDKVPAFLESLTAPQYRVFARALLAGLGDTGDPKSAGYPDRETRLADAAKAMAENAAAMSKDLATRTLMLLGDTPSAAALADHIAGAVEGLSLTMLPDATNQVQARQREGLLRMHLRHRMRAGDLALVRKELTSLAKLESNRDYERDQLLNRICTPLLQESNASLARMDEATRAANRVLWTDVLVSCLPSQYFRSGYGVEPDQRVLHVMMLYAFDDKMADFRAALAAQPEDMRTRLREILRQADFISLASRMPSWPWSKNAAELARERSRLTARLMQTPLGFPGFDRGDSSQWLRQHVNQKWLRKEDLAAVTPVITATDGRQSRHGGLPAIELAGFALDDGQPAKALEFLKIAAKHANSGSVNTLARNLCGHAAVLSRMDRHDDALRVLESFDPEKLASAEFTGASRQTYEKMLGELQLKSAMAAGPDKVMAAISKRIEAGPEAPAAWETCITGATFLARHYQEANQPAEAAGWHMLAAMTCDALGRKDKARADADAVSTHLEQYALAASNGAGTSRRDFLTLVPKASRWRYLDDGKTAPPHWFAAEFDDTAWPEGNGPLGYGDPNMGTEIKPGGTDAQNRAITCYLRQAFEVKEPAGVESLHLHFRCDDACVVYLNGTEITRHNLPEGEVSATTAASRSISGADEDRWHRVDVPPASLKAGRNVLAMELHQENPRSSDLHGDAMIRANERPAADVIRAWRESKLAGTAPAFIEKLPESFRKALEP